MYLVIALYAPQGALTFLSARLSRRMRRVV